MTYEPADRQELRRAEMLCALVATVPDRPLTQLEDAALFAVAEMFIRASLVGEAPLRDVDDVLTDPPTDEDAAPLERGNSWRSTSPR